MADVQDDDQWLYGDEKDEAREDGEINDKSSDPAEKETEKENVPETETPMEESGGGGEGEGVGEGEGEGEEAAAESEKNAENKEKEKENEGNEKGEKEKDGEKEDNEKEDGDDSSDEDDLTITIGVLKTQPDIIQAPTAPHQARFQPKPQTQNTGLKDEDFNSPGKVNGVPITEYSVADLEDKPWRKPGADISDYFNYGFNEESWFKYCERQKRMRINESGSGLTGLGICTPKPFGMSSNSISMTIVNDNSKYGGGGTQRPRAGPPPRNKGMGQIDVIGAPPGATKPSTIQVMTADRRAYSSKVMMNGPPPPLPPSEPGYNDMEFGGNPYGDSYYPGDGPFYGEGGNFDSPPWGPPGVQPVPMGQPNWGDGPAPVPPPTVTPVSSAPGYFEEEPPSAPPTPQEPEEERHRSRRTHRSRSRSPTRHSRHSSSRHARSRSRSPSHRHKRKKSKRERDVD